MTKLSEYALKWSDLLDLHQGAMSAGFRAEVIDLVAEMTMESIPAVLLVVHDAPDRVDYLHDPDVDVDWTMAHLMAARDRLRSATFADPAVEDQRAGALERVEGQIADLEMALEDKYPWGDDSGG